MIIKTSCGRTYRVFETNTPELAHVWYGVPVKKTRNGWEDKVPTSAQLASTLVRKAGSVVVQEAP